MTTVGGACPHDPGQRKYFDSHLAVQYQARAFKCEGCGGNFIEAPHNRIFPYKIFATAAESRPRGKDGQG